MLNGQSTSRAQIGDMSRSAPSNRRVLSKVLMRLKKKLPKTTTHSPDYDNIEDWVVPATLSRTSQVWLTTGSPTAQTSNPTAWPIQADEPVTARDVSATRPSSCMGVHQMMYVLQAVVALLGVGVGIALLLVGFLWYRLQRPHPTTAEHESEDIEMSKCTIIRSPYVIYI